MPRPPALSCLVACSLAFSGAAACGGGGGGTGDAGGDGGAGDAGPPDAPFIDAMPANCPNDVPPEDGWILAFIEIDGLMRWVSAPVVSCDVSQSARTLRAEGVEMDGMGQARLVLGLSPYVGPGGYSGGLANGISAEVFHEDLGTFVSGAGTTCEVCVRADDRTGTYNCLDLESGGTGLIIHAAAFACP